MDLWFLFYEPSARMHNVNRITISTTEQIYDLKLKILEERPSKFHNTTRVDFDILILRNPIEISSEVNFYRELARLDPNITGEGAPLIRPSAVSKVGDCDQLKTQDHLHVLMLPLFG
jgi:hypothetical protein